ncbi:MAG: DHH family phosphoesterase [Candidatus Odinarchaeia archaeon]
MEKDITGFLSKANEISKVLKETIDKGKVIKIFSHIDADGLSAAGIIGKALARENCPFQIRIFKQLKLENIKEIAKDNSDECYIFCDFGSGQIKNLEQYLGDDNKFFIFDHHEAEKDYPLQLNPHIYGLNGSLDISGAGTTYIIAKALNQENRDLSALALIGAVGDIQDIGPQRSFIGLNKEVILKDSIESGVIENTKDIILFGAETRPLHLSLKYTTDPYIPGLSGNEENCINFLKSLDIELTKENNWRTLSDLSREEKVKLYSGLVTYMLQQGVDSEKAQELIGNKYILLKEEKRTFLRDIREFASILNACGRNGYPGLGVAICLGDRDSALKKAQQVLNDYRQKISNYLTWLSEPGRIKEMKKIKVIHGEDVIEEKMIGTIASILSRSNTIGADKALICYAYTDEGDRVKVSARGTHILVEKGLDLGKALKTVIQKMGLDNFEAGGHDIAAGAEIPIGSENTFSAYLDKVIEQQLGR